MAFLFVVPTGQGATADGDDERTTSVAIQAEAVVEQEQIPSGSNEGNNFFVDTVFKVT